MYDLASGSRPSARLAGIHVFCGHLHLWLDKQLFSFFLIACCSVLGVRTGPWREKERERDMGGGRKNGIASKTQWFVCELQQTQPCYQHDEIKVLIFFLI